MQLRALCVRSHLNDGEDAQRLVSSAEALAAQACDVKECSLRQLLPSHEQSVSRGESTEETSINQSNGCLGWT